ncbi:AAA domain-containing protein [Azospirillum sp. TSO5]|uniref:AAA domain-containing protein n=1 Tax=Azospirillum sp. TSO5 TaxID=716760 RepID=UPI000D649155|nr:AAA domain-containing protein [Azospirillum sp. TSO5]
MIDFVSENVELIEKIHPGEDCSEPAATVPPVDLAKYWGEALLHSALDGLRTQLPRLIIPGEPSLLADADFWDRAGAAQWKDNFLPRDEEYDKVPVMIVAFAADGAAVGPRFQADEARTGRPHRREHDEDDPDDTPDESDAGSAEGIDVLFHVPAQIDRMGRLQPPYLPAPGFMRMWLREPPCVGNRVTVADHRRVVALLDDFEAGDGWSAYWSNCVNFFEQATGNRLAGFEWRGHGRPLSRLAFAIMPWFGDASVRALRKCYRHIVTGNRAPALLKHLAGDGPEQDRSPPDDALHEKVREWHHAMVDRRDGSQRVVFPLDPSQRLALMRYGQLAIEERPGLVAVNGPPGTGKTDMLRALIANVWVNAALKGPRRKSARHKSKEISGPEGGFYTGHCPIVAVCGATNQSVENVMDAFGGAADPARTDGQPEDSLRARWIPASDYGFFFPAKSRADKMRKQSADAWNRYHLILEKWTTDKDGNSQAKLAFDGAAAGLENANGPLALIMDYGRCFLASQRKHGERLGIKAGSVAQRLGTLRKQAEADDADSRKAASDRTFFCRLLLADAAAQLKLALCAATERVVAARRTLRAMTGTGADFTAVERYAREQLRDPELSDQGLTLSLEGLREALAVGSSPDEHIERVLDVTVRPVCFHLAARYWEAQWLYDLTWPLSCRQNELEAMAKITPCIVATAHRFPNLAKGPPRSKPWVPLLGRIDLLILDEAGQAPPELAGAPLALARTAVVVGDVKQLAPITELQPPLDRRIALDASLDAAALKARSLLSTSGSAMAMAATASVYGEPGKNGLRLRNHYRCARSIISYCVDLLYHDDDDIGFELTPRVPDPVFEPAWLLGATSPDAFPLPPMGFVQCGSPNDEPVPGDSWMNPGEADRILQWLKDNGPALLRHAEMREGPDPTRGLGSMVAIVTPYSGQAARIRALVQEAVDGKDLPPRGSKDIIIGTVHALQGAERPVVLFSAVNSVIKQGTEVFLDRDGPAMLNVAVSRAKKSFILFGHSELFFSEEAFKEALRVPGKEQPARRPTAVLGAYMAGILADRPRLRWPDKNGVAIGLGGIKFHPTALVVVESPLKAKKIEKVLPDAFSCFGTRGHIRDIDFGDVAVSTGMMPHWRVGEYARDLLRKVAVRLLQTRHLVLATDADAQGEAIAWHVLQALKRSPFWTHVRTISRVRFYSLDEREILRAFAAAETVTIRNAQGMEIPGRRPEQALHMGLVYAALGQRVIDNYLGDVYSARGVSGGGRVKGPLLRALLGDPAVDRGGITVSLDLQVDGTVFDAELHVEEDGELRCWSTDDRGEAVALAASFRKAKLEAGRRAGDDRLVVWPPESCSAVDVMRSMWLRGRDDAKMTPGQVARALQELYEGGWDEGSDEEPKKDPAFSAKEGEPASDMEPWCRVSANTGRIELTGTGRRAATLCMTDKVLSRVGSRNFLDALDDSLVELSENHAATEADYKAWLRAWIDRIGFDTVPDRIEGPDGTDDAQDLFSGFPAMPERTAYDAFAMGLDPDLEIRRLVSGVAGRLLGQEGGETWSGESGEGEPSDAGEDPASDFGTDAHPPLTPTDVWVEPNEQAMDGFSADARAVYRTLHARTVSAVFLPALYDVQHLAWPLPSGGGTRYWALVRFGRRVQDGLLQCDPEREREIEADLCLDAAPDLTGKARIAGARVRCSALLQPRVDTLLGWMEGNGLGRPRTTAGHLADLLEKPRPPIRASYSEEADNADR